MKKKLFSGAFALAGLLGLSNLAHANYLNLMEGYPDIEATDLNVNYDAPSQQFTVVGDGDWMSNSSGNFDNDSLAFDSNSADSDMLIAQYAINADIDSSGNLVGTNNTITITGYDVNGTDGSPDASDFFSDNPSAVLLQGTLTNVGLNGPGGSVLGFTFNVTGGVFQNLFVPNNRGGINLTVVDAGNAITPDFSGSFTGDESGSYSDNFIVVPTPAAMTGGAALLGVLGAATWRRANKNRA